MQVLEEIRGKVTPLLYKVAMSGFLEFDTTAPLFEEDVAVDILIDVLTDRGFGVSYRRHLLSVPFKVDLQTGDISTRRACQHRFHITFPGGSVRDVQHMHSSASQRCVSHCGTARARPCCLPRALTPGVLLLTPRLWPAACAPCVHAAGAERSIAAPLSACTPCPSRSAIGTEAACCCRALAGAEAPLLNISNTEEEAEQQAARQAPTAAARAQNAALG